MEGKLTADAIDDGTTAYVGSGYMGERLRIRRQRQVCGCWVWLIQSERPNATRGIYVSTAEEPVALVSKER